MCHDSFTGQRIRMYHDSFICAMPHSHDDLFKYVKYVMTYSQDDRKGSKLLTRLKNNHTKTQVQEKQVHLSLCVAVCCRVLQCVARCCRVLQGVAGCCSVLQCHAVWCSVMQCLAVCVSVLHYVVVCCPVCCRVLQFFVVLQVLFYFTWKHGFGCCHVLHCVLGCRPNVLCCFT